MGRNNFCFPRDEYVRSSWTDVDHVIHSDEISFPHNEKDSFFSLIEFNFNSVEIFRAEVIVEGGGGDKIFGTDRWNIRKRRYLQTCNVQYNSRLIKFVSRGVRSKNKKKIEKGKSEGNLGDVTSFQAKVINNVLRDERAFADAGPFISNASHVSSPITTPYRQTRSVDERGCLTNVTANQSPRRRISSILDPFHRPTVWEGGWGGGSTSCQLREINGK